LDELPADGKVRVLVPEALKELGNCRWDGDGHFDMTQFHQNMPPSLGQLCMYCRLLDKTAASCNLVVHLSTHRERSIGAMLAGAYMVCAQNCSGQDAWAKILKAGPEPSRQPRQAWDRFPLPFASRAEETTTTSCTVLDCLDGLEVARDHKWLDYRTFDVEAWSLMRRKFDASWIIPGEMIALGDPCLTAQNPAYPDLLEPYASPKKEPFTTGEESEVSKLERDTFVSLLRRLGVGAVVRLNRLHEVGEAAHGYEGIFKRAGVEVFAYEFNDGETPPRVLCKAFVADAKKRKSAKRQHPVMAVHCKAGLGRTGVIIGAYAAEMYQVNGKAFHGWARIVRPGTIQTHSQEKYVRAMEPGASKSCMPCLFG
jgi:cell division cycle 14